MDRKSIIILVLCFVLLLSWNKLTMQLFGPGPVVESGTNATQTVAEPSPVATNPPGQAAASLPPTNAPAFLRPEALEETVTIENSEARYLFTSHGGGLKQIELKEYPATVDCGSTNQLATNQLATLNRGAQVPILALLGSEAVQGDGEFQLIPIANGIRMEKLLPSGLRVVKQVMLGTNYLLRATVTLENTTGEPLPISAHELVMGTATPIGLRDETQVLGLQWYNGTKEQSIGSTWFANPILGCFPSGNPRERYESEASSNAFWLSSHSQFFAIVAIPSAPALQVVGQQVKLPPPSEQEFALDTRVNRAPQGFQASFRYAELSLGPNQTIERELDIYAGPKEYNTISRVHPELKLDQVMQFGFFGMFAKPLLLSMNGLHALGIAYGLVIVVITVLIKLIFWPLTTASTRSMKRMAALQPQMKAIQDKYKDEPRKMQTKLMEFMKENKVSPVAGCLPMLVQIPVFIGFYTMLHSAIELRGASFLWACDLSQPDTILVIPGLGLVPLLGVPGLGLPLNPLPLLLGATQIWQARLTPLSPGMDPMQQKMMRYMPLMFMVFFYNYSAGLSLYWTVQNLLSILQMKVTKSNQPVAATPGGATPAPKRKNS